MKIKATKAWVLEMAKVIGAIAGKPVFHTATITLQDKALLVRIADESHTVAQESKFTPPEIEGEDGEEITFSTQVFHDIVGRMNDAIVVVETVEDNSKLSIRTTKKEGMMKLEAEPVSTDKVPKLENDSMMKLTIDDKELKDIVTDASSADADSFVFELVGGKISVEVGDLIQGKKRYTTTLEAKLPESDKTIRQMYGPYFASLVKVLEGEVTLRFGQSMPIELSVSKDTYTARFVYAPRTE